LFPFIDTAPRAARPVAVLGLILINVVVFVWMLGLTAQAREVVLLQYALIPVRYTEPNLARHVGLDPGNFWPLVTDMFMHGGWLHLIFNMWFLWIFGPAMEARFGRLGFLALYLSGGVAANIVHLLTHPDSADPVLGASGAIAAVIAAYAVTYPGARVMTIIPIWIIPLIFPVPAILFAAIWFGLQVLQGASELASPGMAGGVAWWAHIGGFAFGALFALFANGMGLGVQARTTVWTSSRGRRVPDFRPPDFDRRW
jgi:membrane associated rhomboid family serine protease